MIEANRSRTSSLVNNLKIFIKVLISHKLVLEVGVNLETDLVISNTFSRRVRTTNRNQYSDNLQIRS